MALKVVYLNFAELDSAQKVSHPQLTSKLLEFTLENVARSSWKKKQRNVASKKKRVSTTLHQYEDEEEKKNERSEEEKSVEVNITDPVELYKLLADARMKSKFEKHLAIVVV